MLTDLSDVYQLISQSLLNFSLWNISPLLYTMGLSDIHNTSVRAGNSEATVLYRPTSSVHSYLQADQLSMLLLSWGNLGKQIMSVCFLKFPWEILRWTWRHQCKHLFSKLLDSYLLRFLRKKIENRFFFTVKKCYTGIIIWIYGPIASLQSKLLIEVIISVFL